MLPVNQPGSSIPHLLCPRRRLPPDPHDAAVILCSLYPLLSIISCTTYTSSTSSEWGPLCSMHAVAAASALREPPPPPTCSTKQSFSSRGFLGLSIHQTSQFLFHMFSLMGGKERQMQFKNIHKIFAIVQAMKTENPVHKSQLALVCSPLVKLSYSSCVKRN